MPFVYVPFRTSLTSLEEAKKEVERLYECSRNLLEKNSDFVYWFENDFEKDIKTLEGIIEKISSTKEEGKVSGKLEVIRREAKKLKEERTRLILGRYYSVYYSRSKEVFNAFYDLLDYLMDLLQLKT
ncbi:MAG: hypothetical protein QW609_03435 [Candidatus Aenigmatarchaeota archaeon]